MPLAVSAAAVFPLLILFLTWKGRYCRRGGKLLEDIQTLTNVHVQVIANSEGLIFPVNQNWIFIIHEIFPEIGPFEYL